MQKALQVGDWVLIENLHLADDYILEIDQMIAKLDSESTHKNFRLYLSSV